MVTISGQKIGKGYIVVIAVAWDTAVVWVQILAQEPLHVRSTTKKKKKVVINNAIYGKLCHTDQPSYLK